MILGKAAPVISQLRTRLENGITELELYLNDYSFDSTSIVDILTSHEFRDSLHIYTIHVPMEDDASLTYIYKKDFVDSLKRTIELAQKLSDFYLHRVGVVVHVPHFLLYDDYLDYLYVLLYDMFMESPDVDIYIENTTPVGTHEEGYLIGKVGYLFENVRICKYLRSRGMHNIYTLLDLCHAEAVSEFYNRFNDLDLKCVTIKDFIYENKDTLGAIHVATGAGLALTKATHGVALLDKDRITELLGYLADTNLNPLFIIEVWDNDFDNIPNSINCFNAVVDVVNSRKVE